MYSLYKYYGTLNIPHISSWFGLSGLFQALGIDVVHMKNQMSGWKQFSILTGGIAMSAIYMWFFEQLTLALCCYISLVFGIIHFYTMEIDYKYIL